MAHLRPLIMKDSYWVNVEAEIQRLLDLLIYRPLVRVLTEINDEEFFNSMRALVAAISKGTIWYEDGQFKGSFSAATTLELKQLGAKWNTASKTFSLSKADLPTALMFAQANASSRYENLQRQLLTTLADMDITLIDKESKTTQKYADSVDQMEMAFRKSITAIEAVTVAPKLTEPQRAIIAKEWGTNLDLYIKNWSEENILKLRNEIQNPILNGARTEGLVKTIEQNYGVSKRKAKFLARQEGSLLMSKFQQSRYGQLGIMSYRWSTSKDERVRHDHAVLHGQVFRFDQPPITNRKTGARNNPGEDFGCRCTAIPELPK